MVTKFKVGLQAKEVKPVNTQSLPMPINLKDDLTVELALMHSYGIIKTLPFSKHAKYETDPRGRTVLLCEERIAMKDGVLMRKYYGEDEQSLITE